MWPDDFEFVGFVVLLDIFVGSRRRARVHAALRSRRAGIFLRGVNAFFFHGPRAVLRTLPRILPNERNTAKCRVVDSGARWGVVVARGEGEEYVGKSAGI